MNKKDIDKIFEAKRQRRKALAKLPVAEKIRILVQLQKIASPLLMARGIKKKPWVV